MTLCGNYSGVVMTCMVSHRGRDTCTYMYQTTKSHSSTTKKIILKDTYIPLHGACVLWYRLSSMTIPLPSPGLGEGVAMTDEPFGVTLQNKKIH